MDIEKERDIIEMVVGRGLKVADTTAEERFYNRSKRIRKKIFRFLVENVGQLFEDQEELACEAGNFAGCGAVCARRWIKQFTSRNMPYMLKEMDAGYVIWERPKD